MTKVRIKMDHSQKILLKRGLNKNGKGQVFFTKECAKVFNNFIPFKTGRMKDMMVFIETSKIKYNAPYAEEQYYRNKGNGKQGMNNGGLRGPYWDRRSWAVNGDEVVKKTAKFCGVKSK